jgi:NAD(P)H-dependent flavin oxidoreductase YrpB (nitropropane dioxygenase family)
MGRSGFTELIGCRVPVHLAALGGGVGTPELAAAVSEAGGLGMIPNPSSASETEELVAAARARTARPLGVGFLVPFIADDAVEAAGALADVVEFFYGDPKPGLVRLAKANGARVGWQVGSTAEAAAAVEAGCDYVVAQGIEAGGHVRGVQHLDHLLSETLRSVDLPVVAAGGIGSSGRVAQLLAAGACAVRVGTRFVAASESGAHPEYIERLIAASRHDTVLTEAFGIGWPDAPHRVLRSAVEGASAFAGSVVARSGGREIPRFAFLPPTRQTHGAVTAMALYAGEAVDDVRRVQPAAEITAELIEGIV